MKIYLYSDDINLLDLWQGHSEQYECIIINDLSTLLNLKSEIIILNRTCLNDADSTLKKLVKNRNKILLLDNIINFNISKKYLDIGIMGYGNQLMSQLFLNSALASIIENYVWLHPKITQELIFQISKTKISNEKESILNRLTKREKQIALKLINNLNNEEIAQELNISINTLKTHTKKIYEKLQVKNRLSLSLLFQ